MKLTLKNFRCYTNKTFDFGKDGLVLLSGMSGVGKSTVFMAINFCLYGTGTKLQTFGTTNCMVMLEFMDGDKNFIITRTKRPNRLVVLKDGNEYDDLSGQGILNEYFGKTFETTSYVQQNAVKSFILMGPLEKLEFLEKFAFNDVDLSKIKGKCASVIKRRNEDLLYTTSQLEMAHKHFQSMKKPVLVKFPILSGVKYPEDKKEKLIKNERIKHKNLLVLEKRNLKNIEKANQNLMEEKLLHAELQNKEKNLERLYEERMGIEQEIKEVKENYKGDDALKSCMEMLKFLLGKKEILIKEDKLAQDEKRLYDMQVLEKNNKKKVIKELSNKLWNDSEKGKNLQEVNENIETQKELVKDLQTLIRLKDVLKNCVIKEKVQEEDLKKLEETMEDLKDKLRELEMSKEAYTCPSCNVSLHFVDDTLKISDICETNIEEDIEEDIEKNEEKNEKENEEKITELLSQTTKKHKRLSALYVDNERKSMLEKDTLLQISTIKASWEGLDLKDSEVETSLANAIEELEVFKNYKNENLRNENKLKTLRSEANAEGEEGYSENLEIFKADIQKQRNMLEKLQEQTKDTVFSTSDIIMTEEDLRTAIETQKQYKKSLAVLESRLGKIEEEIIEEKGENQGASEGKDVKQKLETSLNSIKEHETNLENLKTERQTLKESLEKSFTLMKNIEEYEKYQIALKDYNVWKDKVQSLEEEESFKKASYTASVILKDKIAEAESIAMTNIVSSINTHAQEYLEIFFPDNPINVRLLPFKTNKKGDVKPQINIEIDYKGSECDISSLSGGEMSRVVLAFTLGLAEIFNTPLLLLDECTASLDQDLTSVVMEGIKNNFSSKLVIVIAHQLVTGSFDRQVCL
jgi:DNA repair exonuclease SbcCD ATPase subunit